MKHFEDVLTLGATNDSYIGVKGKREDIHNLLDACLENQIKNNLPQIGFVITMPCKSERAFSKPDELPEGDLSCPCGNPTHWLIKYEG